MDVKLQEINDVPITPHEIYQTMDNRMPSKTKPHQNLLTQHPSFGVIPDEIHSLKTVEAPQEQQPNLDGSTCQSNKSISQILTRALATS